MAGVQPHLMAAAEFMARKGRPDATPEAVEKVDGEYCWYLDYELYDGHLTLRVRWSQLRGWSVTVWDFIP